MFSHVSIVKSYSSAFYGFASGGSRTAAASKMEGFVIIANGFQSLTIMTKRFILDVAVVLDPSLPERTQSC